MSAARHFKMGIIAYLVGAFVVSLSFLWFTLHRARDSDEWNAVWVFLILGVAVILAGRTAVGFSGRGA